jgi:hypothetical protein
MSFHYLTDCLNDYFKFLIYLFSHIYIRAIIFFSDRLLDSCSKISCYIFLFYPRIFVYQDVICLCNIQFNSIQVYSSRNVLNYYRLHDFFKDRKFFFLYLLPNENLFIIYIKI